MYHVTMIEVRKIFSKNLKRIRLNLDLSQEKFSEIVGIQHKSVSNLESARHFANPDNIDKICAALNILPAQLFMIPNVNLEAKDIEKINLINAKLHTLNSKRIDDIYKIINTLDDNRK